MIEVNLLPGGKKRATRGPSFSFELPEIGGLPTDRWVLGSAAAVIAVVAVAGYLFMTTSGTLEEVRTQVDDAVQDSARYADLIQQAEELRARRDSIAERVEIIQEIDRERYVWPHLMDEVTRALPEFTWLTSFVQTSSGQQLGFRIQGQAGNNFALTRFMQNLEASPFVRNVTLISTELVNAERGNVSRTVSQFTLEASHQRPPLEALETVPLFESGAPSEASGS